jgi:hypothetical protein
MRNPSTYRGSRRNHWRIECRLFKLSPGTHWLRFILPSTPNKGPTQ